MSKPVVNYMFLKDKIQKVFKCNANYAKALGISNQELSNKLNNKSQFTQEQIIASIKLLELSENDVHACFFNV